jgi:hypothetical protein
VMPPKISPSDRVLFAHTLKILVRIVISRNSSYFIYLKYIYYYYYLIEMRDK